MRRLNLLTAALLALASSAYAMQAAAEDTAKNGQGQSGNSQNSSSNSSSQNQAKNGSNRNGNDAQDAQQSGQNANNSKDQSTQEKDQQGSQNRSNQKQDERSSTNSTADRNKSGTADRDQDSDRDRNSARSDRDDQANTRDRSGRDDDRNNDNRSRKADGGASREHSTRRDNMRGPDIGIWFNRSSRDRLVISDVSTHGPIAKLGFREGDRIVSVNGQRITREDEFMRYLLRSDSRRVTVIVLRDNREETIYIEPAVLVDDNEYAQVDPLERFGIILDDRYDDRIVVWRVIPRSPAYYAGFRPGDVIVTFSGRPYRTRTEFETGSRTWKTGDANVQIRRGEKTRELSVEIPNADRSDRRSERSQVRDTRTAQRDGAAEDQGNANQNDQNAKDRNTNGQRSSNSGGILNGIRPRGNR